MNHSSDALSAGRSAIQNADWVEAKKQFERSLKDLDSPEAHDGLGLAL